MVAAVGLASLAVAITLGWSGVREEREFRRLVADGDAALNAGRTAEAIEAFSGALALRPESMLAHLKRGDAYLRRGDHAPALRDLGRASDLDRGALRPIELLGDALAAMDRHDDAVRHYQRYLELDDLAPRVLYKLALSEFRLGRIDAALSVVERVLLLDEALPEAHYLAGLCLRDRRRHQEAAAAFARAIELDPTFSAAREALAATYLALNRPGRSLEELEALAVLDDAPRRFVALGLAHARMGRPDLAALALGRAAERYPGDSAVPLALARIWLDAADTRRDPALRRRALDLLRHEASRPGATAEARTLYGRALLRSDLVAEAERVLEQATQTLPVDPEAFADLAEAAERLGHTALARTARARHRALTR